MSQSGTPGDHSVRSLAEILREHGLESEFGTRPGRRRREDEPKADWPARPAPEEQPRSRLRPPTDTPADAGPGPDRARPRDGQRDGPREEAPRASPREARRDAPGGTPAPVAAQVPRQPQRDAPRDARAQVRQTPRAAPRETPREAGRERRSVREQETPAGPPREERRSSTTGGIPRFGRRSTDVPLPESLIAPPGGPTTAAIPGLRPSRKPGVPGAAGADDRQGADPLTGPIPITAADARAADARARSEPQTGPQSALAWARFAGELVVAVAAGVAIYFAFTVLWELLPYVALVAAPLAVTGLVAGVSGWRHRQGHTALGVRLLAVLLFAGTVLVIAPAAGLLAGG